MDVVLESWSGIYGVGEVSFGGDEYDAVKNVEIRNKNEKEMACFDGKA